MRGRKLLWPLAILALAVLVVAFPLLATVRGPARESIGNGLSTGGGSMSGPIDMNNNIIENIGAAGTDFTATGGLVVADSIDLNGNPLIVDADGDSLIDYGLDDHIRIRPGGGTVAEFDTNSVDLTVDLWLGGNDLRQLSNILMGSGTVKFGGTSQSWIVGDDTSISFKPATSTALLVTNTKIFAAKPLDFQSTHEQVNNVYAEFDEQASVPAPGSGNGITWVDGSTTPNRQMFTNENNVATPTENHILQTQYSEVTTDQTYSPAIAYTWNDLAPLTTNITTSGAYDLLINLHVSASNPNANRDFRVRIRVDGVSIGGASSELRTGGVASSVSMVRKTSVAAGARVVTVQWTTNGTINCRPVAQADIESASISVQEVR